MDGNITKGFVLLLVGVFLFSSIGTYGLIDYFGDKGAQDQVYAKCMDPVSVEDVDIGQARLKAQLGFMDMNLQQLAEFYGSVDWNIDQYAYESWKLPSLFYDEREGDCEDFVLFALSVLDHHVYDLHPTLGKYDNVGHAWLIVNDSIMVDSIYGVCDLDKVDMSHCVALLHYSDMLEGSLFQGILGRVATWDGGGADNLASTKENWDGPDIAPIVGDTIVFNTGSKACTWDVAATFAGFYMNASYTGTVTQGSGTNFGVSCFYINSGTFTGYAGKTLTCSGDFIRNAGTISNYVLTLILTGSNNEIKTFNSYYSLNITGNYVSKTLYSFPINTNSDGASCYLRISGSLTLI